jgi:hypothetical protein
MVNCSQGRTGRKANEVWANDPLNSDAAIMRIECPDVVMSRSVAMAKLCTIAIASLGGLVVALSATGAAAQSFTSRSDRGFDAQFRQADKTRDKLKSAGTQSDTAAQEAASESTDDGDEKPANRMKFYSGAAVLGGHDSNIDMTKTNGAGSGFGMVDVGVASVVTRESSETTAIARGSFQRQNLELRPERWDGGFLVDHYMKMSGGWKAHLGGFIERNEIENNRPMYAGAYMQFAKNAKTEDAFVRVRSLQTLYGRTEGEVVNAGFMSDVDASFNHTKTEAAVGMLVLKDRALAPFFEVSAARVEFTNQVNTALLNRNAYEVYGIAGVRLTINPKLRIDVGGRVNSRELEDTRVSHHTSAYFDGKIVWAPSEMVDIEFNIERKNTEASTAGALFTERTQADLQVTAKLNDKLKVRGEVGIAKLDQIGLNKSFEERYVEGRIGYQVSKRAELFAMAKAETVKDSETADVIDRVRVGAGVKVGF